jgi:transcriptional regulator with XRE-family HTH domain
MLVRQAHELGQVVFQRRLDVGLTQLELAERVGVTRQWLARLEKGIGEPPLAKVLLVLRELDLTIDVQPKPADLPHDVEFRLPNSEAIHAAAQGLLARLAMAVEEPSTLSGANSDATASAEPMEARAIAFNLERVAKNLTFTRGAEDDA